MSTKQKVDRAIKALNGTVVDNSVLDFDVELVAPKGHIWSDFGGHIMVINWPSGENKEAFWKDVMSEIPRLGNAVPCTADTCNEWIDGVGCEFWRDD